MTGKARIGILGGGGIVGAHAAGYHANLDRAQVIAVAEPRPECADRLRELFGNDVRIEADYRDVIAADDIDAVDIVLPHDLHMPATIAAAEAGKPVLVEKVMARNVYECDRMIEACDRAGVSLTVCHDRRYHGQWMALKQIVDSGVLGEIFWWKLDHNQNVVGPEGHWLRSRDRLGGGAIMSCLTHQIDSLRWYGGEVQSLACMTKTKPERMEGEFAGVIIAQMESGALAHLAINWWTTSNASENGLWYEMVQVCGTKGEAYYMSGRGTFLKLHTPADSETPWQYEMESTGGFSRVKSGDWVGHVRCIGEWIKSVRGEPADLYTDGRAVRGTVEVAEAAYLAEATGCTVTLPIEPKPWPGTV
ncbi:MAG: Gfo/Idh/MocA family oxidoreductase [Acidobacteriota bacterium]|jgi:predicted dehydrogenase|nr:Gfo/Idh/MocA family oxidoreductase [Acidobacteriota bacterium]